MDYSRGRAGWRRYLAGGSVSLIGCLLLTVPVYDIWDDTTDLSWSIAATLGENALFLALAGALVGGGIWLVRSDLETDYVTTIARRTVATTALTALLIGWAVFLQLHVMSAIKPGVIALDGVLVGAVASFGLSVSSVRANLFEEQADHERALNDRLELLYRAASDLEGATTHEAAYDVIDRAVETAVAGSPFRVVVDGNVVVDRSSRSAAASPAETVSIGARGRIELLGESFQRHEVVTVELFASYLDETIQRIEREETLREERDILEFINRTIRHDLMGDITLVQARLRTLERNAKLADSNAEHLAVALDRAEEMEEFVGTMRTYMQSVLAEDHALEAVALGPLVDEHVESIRQSYPEVEIDHEGVPAVTVEADDLLDRVLANLLENAVEHNDTVTPQITVDGDRQNGWATVRISDNGPGIPSHRRAAIFEQGERGTESDGTGFGLYLVKDVVESYGGDVRIRDNEPRGTVFEVDLPIAGEDST